MDSVESIQEKGQRLQLAMTKLIFDFELDTGFTVNKVEVKRNEGKRVSGNAIDYVISAPPLVFVTFMLKPGVIWEYEVG